MWIVAASLSISNQTIRNAWRRTGFEWFAKDEGQTTQVEYYESVWEWDR